LLPGGGGPTAFALKMSTPIFRVPCRCACMSVADICMLHPARRFDKVTACFSCVAAACNYLSTLAYLLAA
jgi:hypothetical protein